MRRYDHGHAIFDDGHEVEFGFTGWPSDLLEKDDTEETKGAREAKRVEHLGQTARVWAGPGYEDMEVKKLWLAG